MDRATRVGQHHSMIKDYPKRLRPRPREREGEPIIKLVLARIMAVGSLMSAHSGYGAAGGDPFRGQGPTGADAETISPYLVKGSALSKKRGVVYVARLFRGRKGAKGVPGGRPVAIEPFGGADDAKIILALLLTNGVAGMGCTGVHRRYRRQLRSARRRRVQRRSGTFFNINATNNNRGATWHRFNNVRRLYAFYGPLNRGIWVDTALLGNGIGRC
jgi:hypothetical protein